MSLGTLNGVDGSERINVTQFLRSGRENRKRGDDKKRLDGCNVGYNCNYNCDCDCYCYYYSQALIAVDFG